MRYVPTYRTHARIGADAKATVHGDVRPQADEFGNGRVEFNAYLMGAVPSSHRCDLEIALVLHQLKGRPLGLNLQIFVGLQ